MRLRRCADPWTSQGASTEAVDALFKEELYGFLFTFQVLIAVGQDDAESWR